VTREHERPRGASRSTHTWTSKYPRLCPIPARTRSNGRGLNQRGDVTNRRLTKIAREIKSAAARRSLASTANPFVGSPRAVTSHQPLIHVTYRVPRLQCAAICQQPAYRRHCASHALQRATACLKTHTSASIIVIRRCSDSRTCRRIDCVAAVTAVRGRAGAIRLPRFMTMAKESDLTSWRAGLRRSSSASGRPVSISASVRMRASR